MAERATDDIPIDPFRADSDDWDTWAIKFEKAIRLATKAGEDRLLVLALDWIMFKLDEKAFAIYENCAKDTWANLKADMSQKLVSKSDIYRWKAGKLKLKWDGIEPFMSLANKCKRAVDKYEKNLTPDGKVEKYFFVFREALPTEYIMALDMALDEDERKIDNAVKVAERRQMSCSAAEAGNVTFIGAAFAGAALTEDRVKALELGQAQMVNKLDELSLEIRKSRNMRKSNHKNKDHSEEKFKKKYKKSNQSSSSSSSSGSSESEEDEHWRHSKRKDKTYKYNQESDHNSSQTDDSEDSDGFGELLKVITKIAKKKKKK